MEIIEILLKSVTWGISGRQPLQNLKKNIPPFIIRLFVKRILLVLLKPTSDLAAARKV